MRVLYVEDNRAARELARIVFGRSNIKLEVVESVREAQGAIKTNSYDAIVTDLQMPGLDGEYLAKWAKEHYPSLPVIICSVYWERAKEVDGDYIKKPLTPQNLKAKLCGEEEETNVYKLRFR